MHFHSYIGINQKKNISSYKYINIFIMCAVTSNVWAQLMNGWSICGRMARATSAKPSTNKQKSGISICNTLTNVTNVCSVVFSWSLWFYSIYVVYIYVNTYLFLIYTCLSISHGYINTLELIEIYVFLEWTRVNEIRI